jgi:hypothetical protein
MKYKLHYNFMTKDRIIAIGAIVVAILIFVLFAFSFRQSGSEDQFSDLDTADDVIDQATTSVDGMLTATSTPTTTEKTTAAKTTVKASPGAVSQSYADALKTYSASGYRFQIVDCQMTPGSLVIKKGSTFMVDNRDNAAHKIAVGNTNYSVGAYGFVIATAKVLGVNYIRCDNRGSAKITVSP